MKPINKPINIRELALFEAGTEINLLPVIEKELIHYDILRAMSEGAFLEKLCFQGGTSLRLCYGSLRYSEDLDFTGGLHFSAVEMQHLKQCIEDNLSSKYGLSVEVKEPKEKSTEGVNISTWQVKVITAPQQKHISAQKIKIEVANIPSHTKQTVQLIENYELVSGAPILINVQSREEIMVDKLLALPMSVKNIRHRDIWDLNWLVSRGITPALELLDKKVKDYTAIHYIQHLRDRIDSLPGIVNGEDFMNQMSRFLKKDTIDKTVGRPEFRTSMIETVNQLLSSAFEERTLSLRAFACE